LTVAERWNRECLDASGHPTGSRIDDEHELASYIPQSGVGYIEYSQRIAPRTIDSPARRELPDDLSILRALSLKLTEELSIDCTTLSEQADQVTRGFALCALCDEKIRQDRLTNWERLDECDQLIVIKQLQQECRQCV